MDQHSLQYRGNKEKLEPYQKPVKMGRAVKCGDVVQPVGHFAGVNYVAREMGCEWMGQKELAQAIPPAYTRWIGAYLMAEVKRHNVDLSHDRTTNKGASETE